MSVVGSITRAATRKPGEPYNILSFVCHERYEPNLAKINANFFSIAVPGTTRDWNTKVAPIPANYTITRIDQLTLPKVIDAIPQNIDFDFIISHNRLGHYDICKQISQHLHLPLICVEHTDAMPFWSDAAIKDLNQRTRGDFNVFISEYNRDRFLFDETNSVVIEHGIQSDVFHPSCIERENYILAMCNDWIGRDVPCGFSVWQRVTKDLPVRVVGDTVGLSVGSNSLEECVSEFQKARIFINTSQFSPVPMALLEAMSCGCAIVTSATCMMPEIIDHGVNGFITNDEIKMREYLVKLLKNPDMCIEMGENARKTILTRFSMTRFVNEWESLLNKASKFIYKG